MSLYPQYEVTFSLAEGRRTFIFETSTLIRSNDDINQLASMALGDNEFDQSPALRVISPVEDLDFSTSAFTVMRMEEVTAAKEKAEEIVQSSPPNEDSTAFALTEKRAAAAYFKMKSHGLVSSIASGDGTSFVKSLISESPARFFDSIPSLARKRVQLIVILLFIELLVAPLVICLAQHYAQAEPILSSMAIGANFFVFGFWFVESLRMLFVIQEHIDTERWFREKAEKP